MNRILAVAVFLVLIALPASAQKQRYSSSSRPDPLLYPLTIHVSGSRTFRMPVVPSVTNGSSVAVDAVSILHLDAVIDGRKVGLEAGASALLHPGDYAARVLSQDEKKSGWFSRTYDLLFTDGTHVVFTQVAESE